jgi:hypothetical protein
MFRFRFGDMESLLLGLEKELRATGGYWRRSVGREAGVQEVSRLRAELAQEVAAMQKVQAAHRSRVVLASHFRWATLRSRPCTIAGRH